MATHYTLPNRPLSIWKSPSLDDSVFAMTISKIEVRGEETPDGTLFHFHLALVGEDGDFIRLDNAPSYTDMSCPMRGLLRVDYDGLLGAPPPEPEVFVAVVREGTDATTLCRYLLDQDKVEQYIFTDSGHGCRHWCATVLSRLADAGFVDQEIGDIFAAYEEREVQKFGDKFPMPRITGTFYD
ncbi:hypothetical protein K443DRAFT_683731 [Laccaria amethystina LaAM-08-1]|uniref:DUF7770 domain-containing protein n=1 Tax=Laccaria amethystina LaAM-08-1 TaxID=1095629 RepID=A0A0C9WJC7_9AGAR|nr:hypothetical protein K443DRAFT_683731 [Laccaria amethystina LaAM-08-1]